MSDSAERLLDLLAERKLLAQVTIDSLRRQIRELPDDINAHQVAQLLQRKGKLTAYQSRELLADVGERVLGEETSAAATSNEAVPSEKTSTVDDDELGLADIDDEEDHHHRAVRILGQPPSKADVEEKKAAPKAPTPPKEPSTTDEPAALSSGIDDLLDDPLLSAQEQAADPLQPVAAAKQGWGRAKKFGKRRAVGWDTPLIYLGGGALLFLIALSGFLIFVLMRGSGDELFKAAEHDYLDGKYARAIEQYDEFVARHSGHPSASLARVHATLARLRIAVAEETPSAALDTARRLLPGIEEEPALETARPELAGLLPEMAVGFAQAAAKNQDMAQAAEIVAQYKSAMELVDNPVYLPASQRAAQDVRLERAAEMIATVVRRIEQQSRLEETVAVIRALTAEGKAKEAYAQRDALLKLYPRLHDDEQLADAVTAVSASLVAQVEVTEEEITAANTEEESPIAAEIALAHRSGGKIDALQGRVVTMVIDGVLYALAADDGRLLWRRHVGSDTASALPVDAGAGADLIVVDSDRWELLRLRATDGNLVWRLPVGKPFAISRSEATPPGDGKLWLSLQPGQLWEVQLETGRCGRQVHFPQSLAAGAALDARGGGDGGLLQLAEHSNLYVLNSESLKCEEVVYLGHMAGTIDQTPIAAAGLLFVAHNAGLRRAQLRVLRWRDDSPHWREAQPPLRFDSRLADVLTADPTRMVALAADGGIFVLGIDVARSSAPVEVAATRSGGIREGAVMAATSDDYLLIAQGRLDAYRMSTARRELTPRWANHDGDQFVGQLRVIDGYLFHARRRAGQAGVIIAATARDAQQSGETGRPIWETTIAPGAVEGGLRMSPDDGSLRVYCATGEVFEAPAGAAGKITLNEPALLVEHPGRYSRAIKWNDDRVLLVGREQIASPPADDPPPAFISASDLADVDWMPAAAWRGGLLAPSPSGRISFIAADAAAEKLHPFLPRLVIGETTHWLRPAAVDRDRFLAADRRGRVYLVGVSAEGAPHLAALATATAAAALVAPPACSVDMCVAVGRSESSDVLVRYNLPELEFAGETPLGGRLRWGPYRRGKLFLLLAEPGGLQALRADGTRVWSCDLDGQLPAGPPLDSGGEITIATTSGRILRVRQTDGEIVARRDLGQPLAQAPIDVGDKRVAVQAADGTVLLIERDIERD